MPIPRRNPPGLACGHLEEPGRSWRAVTEAPFRRLRARGEMDCGVCRPVTRRSGGCVSLLYPDEAAHIVGEIGETDLHGGPRQPDGSDEQSKAVLLSCEHRLYGGAHLRARGVRLHLGRGEIGARLAAEVNLGEEPAPGEMALVAL